MRCVNLQGTPTHPRNINADSELLLKFQVNAKN